MRGKIKIFSLKLGLVLEKERAPGRYVLCEGLGLP